MGYYTCYTLYAKTPDDQRLLTETSDAINEWLKEHQIIGYALGEYEDDDTNTTTWEWHHDCKWYEHDEDMQALSEAFPDVVFCLHGVGEEQYDEWDSYWHHGENEECRVEVSMPKPERIKWIE